MLGRVVLTRPQLRRTDIHSKFRLRQHFKQIGKFGWNRQLFAAPKLLSAIQLCQPSAHQKPVPLSLQLQQGGVTLAAAVVVESDIQQSDGRVKAYDKRASGKQPRFLHKPRLSGQHDSLATELLQSRGDGPIVECRLIHVGHRNLKHHASLQAAFREFPKLSVTIVQRIERSGKNGYISQLPTGDRASLIPHHQRTGGGRQHNGGFFRRHEVTDVFDDELAASVADALRQGEHRIVFAESCTAGLLSASLARIPGVSAVLAGSAVTYQIATKTQWLNVSAATIDTHDVVSEQVSREMACGALELTPHATISASITGHLGPDAPASLDGTAFCTVSVRTPAGLSTHSRRLQLVTLKTDGLTQRRARQIDAVSHVLRFVRDCLSLSESA